MKVPFRLSRRAESEPAVALLVLSERVEDVLALCRRLGCDPLPAVYRVAGGFLLRLTQPPQVPVAGCVRLRALAGNLLLPVDADLEPALLPDEAQALGRRRGLVFLPGGRVLEFTPTQPLPLSALVTAPVRRGRWQTLPELPPLADRITEIVLDTPPEAADEVLAAGGEGIGTEAPPPTTTGLPRRALGKATYGLGKGLGWLGQKLGLGGLTRAGAKLLAGAMALAPGLSEKLLGRQAAQLRELLREFREGSIERALRRALPLGGATARGSSPASSDWLPTRGILYSLFEILRGGGGAPAALWYTPDELYRELEQEYRRQAEAAAQRGDYRRAAFIYARLLNDYRGAALVLARGGLHRDSALIYQHKLHDYLAAAREYEAAGDFDRALKLYRQCGEHALAGDLLRRAGEEELAVAEYQLAAAKLVSDNPAGGLHQAGELLLTRARRPDLAIPYFEKGWQQRPRGTPLPCAVRLVQLHTQNEEVEKLRVVVTEAQEYLEPPGNDGPASEFFNEVARLADLPALAVVREELRDRALLGLAGKMRQHTRHKAPAAVVSGLMGAASPWPPAVVSDAQFALRHERARRTAAVQCATTPIGAAGAVVTAVCWAPESGEIFLGFQSGEVYLFRPASGEVVAWRRENHAVHSLAASSEGKYLLVLFGGEDQPGYLASHFGQGFYRVLPLHQPIQPDAGAWLCPLVPAEADPVVGLWDGRRLQLLQASHLLPVADWTGFTRGHPPTAGLVLSSQEDDPSGAILNLFLFAGNEVGYWREHASPRETVPSWKSLGWGPWLPERGTLRHPTFSWLPVGSDRLELVGIGADCRSYWSELELDAQQIRTTRTFTIIPPSAQRSQAATLIRGGLVAVVSREGVGLFRRRGSGFEQVTLHRVALGNAVACFPHLRGNELIVICADGTVARVAPLLS